MHALSSHSSPQTNDYSDSEISIRDSFDRLLGSLERFQNFADAHLVTTPELAPYLQYWLEIIGDRKNLQKAEKVRRRLWGYIDDYGYEGVQRLLKSFGYDIRP